MKKILVISLILFLISFTAIIKNSTKRVDDQIFAIKENIRGFEKDFENIKLEYDFLSSAEKLLEYQNLYFEDHLIKKNIQSIKIISKTKRDIKITQFNFINE